MNCRVVALQTTDPCFPIYRVAHLILLLWCSTALIAQAPSAPASGASVSDLHVIHVLGLAGVSKSAKGKLTIEGSALQFKKGDGATGQVEISSIQDVILGEQSKQVGGAPMTLGKMATPYGGGRVISLFSHKKYDTVTLQYQDTKGGLHGAIFLLDKGQGQGLKSELVAKGAHVSQTDDQSAKQGTPEVKQ
jgi:hypothetical protein